MSTRSKTVLVIGIIALIVPGVYRVVSRLSRPASVSAREVYPRLASGPTIDHSLLDNLLKRYVSNGWVDYDRLKDEEDNLQRYLDQIAAINPQHYGRDELLALFINAYNATTLKLILEYFPGIQSIRDIPSGKRWHGRRWKVAGELLSIDEIETNVLRTRFVEPRIHFAIVCASVGCPPLRSEAYRGTSVELQLEQQASSFNRSERNVKLEGNTLWVSSIYDWYAQEFEAVAGSVPEYVAPYAGETVKNTINSRGKELRVRYLDYDWGLNHRQIQ